MEFPLDQVLDSYGLGDRGGEVAVERGGHLGTNYRITMGHKKMVLRIRVPQFSPEEVQADHRLLEYLRDKGFPVPGLIPRGNGSTWGLLPDGRIYEMQDYIPHDQTAAEVDYKDISGQLAAFLGRFHRLTRDYPEIIKKTPYLGDIPLGFWEKYFSGPLELGQARYLHSAEQEGGSAGRELRDRTEFLASYLRAIKKRMEKAIPDIPTLINHNDFYGNNILLQRGKVTGLLDFDFCCSGIFYIDLVEMLHGSMIWEKEEEDFWGLPSQGIIRREQGQRDLDLYLDKGPGFSFNHTIMRDMLQAKVISLAFYPAFDMAKEVRDRLEITRRLEKTLSRLDTFPGG